MLVFSGKSNSSFFQNNNHKSTNNNVNITFQLIGLALIIFIGFRDEVGGDWGSYLRHFEFINFYSVLEVLKRSDPGYYIINWFMKDWGFERERLLYRLAEQSTNS